MPQAAHIFVSHNGQDAQWCHDFVAALHVTEADIWYDEHNLGYGQLMNEIERELRARPIFIVVLSPTAVASKWVQREVNAAIDLADHDPQRVVLPMVAERCDIPYLWRGFRRIASPDDGGVAAQEAAGRVIRALALAPASAAVATLPIRKRETKEEAVERGNGLYAQKRYAEALVAYENALNVDSRSATAWQGKGVALISLHSYYEALMALEYALDLDPQFKDAWNGKGSALRNLRRYGEALVAFDRALVLDPQDEFAWNNKGNTLCDLHRYEESLAAFDYALAINPQYAVAWNNKGNALKALLRHDDAISAYDRALAIEPSMRIWNNKIELLRELGRTREVEEAERQYIIALAHDRLRA